MKKVRCSYSQIKMMIFTIQIIYLRRESRCEISIPPALPVLFLTIKRVLIFSYSVIQLFNYSIIQLFNHSLFIASTGFAIAAFTACQPTVIKVNTIVISPANANIHQSILMR